MSGRRRRSLEGRITGLARVGLGLQPLLVALVLGSALLVASDGLHAAAVRDSEVAAADLLAGMADQQTGLLTYLEPAQPDSLLLYTTGQVEVTTSLAKLHAGTAGTPHAAREAALEAAVQGWQRWADAQRVLQQPVTDPVVTTEGRQLFGLFTAAQQELVRGLDAESQQTGDRIRISTAVAVGVIATESLAIAIVVALFALHVVRQVLAPLRGLAGAAELVAETARAPIPYRERQDEVGELARALQGWQETSVERTIVAEQAPVGICRVDRRGRFLIANAALERMLGYDRGELVGKQFWSLQHPDDVPRVQGTHRGLMEGSTERIRAERRWLRRDGSTLWCSV